MDRTKPILEVIACSVSDAIEAEKGGAGRLEVIRDFAAGGLTPPLDLVREILAVVQIPVRVMLRENDGYTVSGAAEIEKLCATARELSKLRLDGLVLGFLRDSQVDLDVMSRILSHAPELKATLHHAFENAKDPYREIRAMKTQKQIDRILAYGGEGVWSEKIHRLAGYEREARPEIMILAGGGLNGQIIRTIRKATCIGEFHVGRAARTPPHTEGVVQAARVRELVELIENSSAGKAPQGS
jgi:copper homeostasis protein